MKNRQGCLLLWSALLTTVFVTGCASGRKQRLAQREKMAASSGMYCDFVNGDKNPEVEIELNMMMAKRCDSDKPFSITNYKTPAEVTGILYCCSIHKVDMHQEPKRVSSHPQVRKTTPKPEVKEAESAPTKGQDQVDKETAKAQTNKSETKKNEADSEDVPL